MVCKIALYFGHTSSNLAEIHNYTTIMRRKKVGQVIKNMLSFVYRYSVVIDYITSHNQSSSPPMYLPTSLFCSKNVKIIFLLNSTKYIS